MKLKIIITIDRWKFCFLVFLFLVFNAFLYLSKNDCRKKYPPSGLSQFYLSVRFSLYKNGKIQAGKLFFPGGRTGSRSEIS